MLRRDKAVPPCLKHGRKQGCLRYIAEGGKFVRQIGRERNGLLGTLIVATSLTFPLSGSAKAEKGNRGYIRTYNF